MEAKSRSRKGSQSSSGARPSSVFSEAESFTTADTSSSQYSEEEDEVVELAKKTFEANTYKELADISEETFEANVGNCDPDDIQDGNLNVIYGSTLGGKDPLHAMVQATGHEPTWWVEERQRGDRSSKKRKLTPTNSRTSKYKPAYFDGLPYSPQDYFTSGLDINCEPEESSEEFWDKVGEAFKLSCRYETVEDRRDQFDFDCFESAPATPTPSRFNDQSSVV